MCAVLFVGTKTKQSEAKQGFAAVPPALQVHQLSESVPPTVMPVLHSSAPQQHLRLLRHRLMCAVLHSLCIACA